MKRLLIEKIDKTGTKKMFRVPEENLEENKRCLRALSIGWISDFHFTSRIYAMLESAAGGLGQAVEFC